MTSNDDAGKLLGQLPGIAQQYQDIMTPKSEAAERLLAEALDKLNGESKENGIRKIMTGRGNNITNVSPFLLRPTPGFNARDFSTKRNQDHVRELARSIAAKGVERPIVAKLAKDGLLDIKDGETRWRAVMLAINEMGVEIRSVPVVQPEAGKNEADLIADQNTANLGQPFSDMELAKNVRRLLKHGWTYEEIEASASVSQDKAERLLRALELPPEVQRMISDEVYALTTVLEEARKADSDEALIAKLKAGLDKAKASGRTKASVRHLAKVSGTLSHRKAIKGLQGVIKTAERVERDGKVYFGFDPATAAQFEAFLALKDAEAAAEAPAAEGEQTDIEDAIRTASEDEA